MAPSTRLIRARPHRLRHARYQGLVLGFFTLCLSDRKAAFLNASVVLPVKDLLAESASRFACVDLASCFMPDHAHVLLRGLDDRADLWRAIVDWKQRSGFWLARHAPGTTWQKGFYDRILRTEADHLACVRYVVANPVRAGLVDFWEDYPFLGGLDVDGERSAG
jgi:putative transposase